MFSKLDLFNVQNSYFYINEINLRMYYCNILNNC